MQNKYEILEIVGEGAYGIVLKCRNREAGEFVAIKKFKDSEDEAVQKSMIRELKVLKKLKHENIVLMKECFKRKGKLYLVFEYIERNLLQVLEENSTDLDQFLIKKIIYQICKGLNCIHNSDTLHRDIKPENILVTENYIVKICDFGFARGIPQKGGLLTDYVATRWYRAPELLLGCSNYGKEVDYWALGCIIGELTDGQPMFPGVNELNQLSLIQNLLGPLPQIQLEIFYSNPRFSGIKLENVNKPETLERRYMGKMSKVALSFLKGLLKLDPRERVSGNDIIMHPYFDEVRGEDPEFNRNKHIGLSQNILKNITVIKNEPLINNVSYVNASSNSNAGMSNNMAKINITQKFNHSKTNFYKNVSKSPPKELVPNSNNSNNSNININSSTSNNLSKQVKIPPKTKLPLDNPIPISSNMNKTSYKTFYALKENKPDIYNFDISTHYEENVKIDLGANPNQGQAKKKKNPNNINTNNLLIISEEQENQKDKLKANQNIINPNHKVVNLNETKNNKFKPDTGADFYDDEIVTIVNPNPNKKHSPKNTNLNLNLNSHILNKTNKITMNFNPNRNTKEESPESRGAFLPHISSYRAFEEGNFNLTKKTKK